MGKSHSAHFFCSEWMSNVSKFTIFRGLNQNRDNEEILHAQGFSSESLLNFLLKPSSYWKEEADRGCCAGQDSGCWWLISPVTSPWALPKWHLLSLPLIWCRDPKALLRSHLNHSWSWLPMPCLWLCCGASPRNSERRPEVTVGSSEHVCTSSRTLYLAT